MITAIEQIVLHVFKTPHLLKMALTHRSVPGHNNERLEFLGDSILNFVMAEALYQQFPQAKEGDLSRLRAQLVKGETLAQIASDYHLGQFLILGEGERKSGGKYRKSILADAMEAIIGAIYLDSLDIQLCQKQILVWYDRRLKSLDLTQQKDPKTRLQEYLQAAHHPLPDYLVTDVSGEEHAQVFTVVCKVVGIAHQTTGQETSRRRAEQCAAENFLAWLVSQGRMI